MPCMHDFIHKYISNPHNDQSRQPKSIQGTNARRHEISIYFCVIEGTAAAANCVCMRITLYQSLADYFFTLRHTQTQLLLQPSTMACKPLLSLLSKTEPSIYYDGTCAGDRSQ